MSRKPFEVDIKFVEAISEGVVILGDDRHQSREQALMALWAGKQIGVGARFWVCYDADRYRITCEKPRQATAG